MIINAFIGYSLLGLKIVLDGLILRNYDIDPIQLSVWIALGSAMAGILYMTFVLKKTEKLIPPENPVITLFVIISVFITILSGVLIFSSYKDFSFPYLIPAASISAVVVQYLIIKRFTNTIDKTELLGLIIAATGIFIFMYPMISKQGLKKYIM